MSNASAVYAVPGFASARKKSRLKPFEERVLIAVKRLTAAIAKYHGRINAHSLGDVVQFGTEHVHNRGNELGGYRNGEFTRVITAAVKKMLTEKVMLLHDDGQLILNCKFKKPRERNQKYPQHLHNPRRQRNLQVA